MNRYEALANAIIVQGVKDFRDAHRKLKKYPDDYKAQDTIRDVEQFFCSDWFTVLSSADGKAILGMLKEEFEA